MKRYLVTFILSILTIFAYAQRFSAEDYKHHLESYITEHAGLTKDEASKFFPLYQELKDKRVKELVDQGYSYREIQTIISNEELMRFE